MKISSIVVSFVSFILFSFPIVPSYAANSHLADRVIVQFRNGVSAKDQDTFSRQLPFSKRENLRLHNTTVLTVPQGQGSALIQKLSRDSRIQYIEKDTVATALEVPNDPYIGYQWGLQDINAFDAWNTTHGSAATVVAVVDTGIDGTHEDLSSKIIGRANFTTDPDVDNNGHGSHVAGIAAADTNNSIGVAGIGYDTRLLSVKVLDSSGSGYYSWIANGVVWAADHGANVINLSLGGSISSRTLQNAINYAVSKNVIVVSAAGNSNSSSPLYPAYYSNVISVAATDSTDAKAYFSSYGHWVKLAAPGVSILSTYPGGYAYLSGTSMATPFVSGLAGLVWGEHPSWSATQVTNKIEQTADAIPGTGTYWQYGKIDACLAVDCSTPTPSTSSGSPTPTLTPSATPTTSVTPSPTLTPTPTTTPSPSPTVSPTPTITPTPTPAKSWWCIYAPWSPFCK